MLMINLDGLIDGLMKRIKCIERLLILYTVVFSLLYHKGAYTTLTAEKKCAIEEKALRNDEAGGVKRCPAWESYAGKED